MIQANIRDAKARLSAYLSQVERGEEVLILRRGKPIAVLRPVEKSAPTPLPSQKAFRNKIKLRGQPASETIIRMREESRY